MPNAEGEITNVKSPSVADITVHFFNVRAGDCFEGDCAALTETVRSRSGARGDGGEFLRMLIRRLIGAGKGNLAVVEEYHVDATYRDAYYTYYASLHLDVPRFTVRVSFFDYFLDEEVVEAVGPYDPDADADGSRFDQYYDVVTWSLTRRERIEGAFLGYFVVNPVSRHMLGRTLLNPARATWWEGPRRLTDGSGTDACAELDLAYMRLSRFELNVAGKRLHVDAFPHYRQDGMLASCAEVTLLSIGQHYENEFNGYVEARLTDIIAAEQRRAFSRVIPSVGLNYRTLCSVLCDMGLQPELLDRKTFRMRDDNGVAGDLLFRRALFSCVESGMPIALNVEPEGDAFSGHSLVCIGHGLPDASREAVARRQGITLAERTKDVGDDAVGRHVLETASVSCNLMNASDFHTHYVVMDDSQEPYSVRNIHALTRDPSMKLARFVVPLQRGMAVGAVDAQSFFRVVLKSASEGILRWGGDWLAGQADSNEGADVVMRVFLASTRRLKPYRVNTMGDPIRASAYAMVPLPHYVWCCELFLLKEFLRYASPESFGDMGGGMEVGLVSGGTTRAWDEEAGVPKAFAELIVDATAAAMVTPGDSILICNYPTRFGYRLPSDVGSPLKMRDVPESEGFPSYCGNLYRVTSRRAS